MHNRVLPVLLLGILAIPLRAQDPAAWGDSTRHLGLELRAIHDSLVQGDSSTAEVGRRGNIVIAASPNERNDAAEALQQFMTVRDRWFADALPSVNGFRVALRMPHGAQSAPGAAASGSVILVGLPDTGSAPGEADVSSTSGRLADALIDHYGQLMYASVPALIEWLHDPPPLSIPEAERRDRAMYAFVTAMAGVQRDCASGDLHACIVALGIRRAPGNNDGAAFSTYLRTDMLLFTLDLGGTGAWVRFRNAAPAGIEPALVAAANQPIDSIMAHWRRGLLERRPASRPLDDRTGAIALVWSALFLCGAVGAARWG